MSSTSIPFIKMNGLGNDFVVIDSRATPIRLKEHEIARIGDRATGIGFDQMITLEGSPAGADVFMRIDNADGGEVSACGNATRCIGWLLMQEKGKDKAVIETRAGLLYASDAGEPELVTVDMGTPKFRWNEIPLAEPFHDTRAIELQIGPIDAPILHSPSVVSMGNPHAIFWVDDVEAYDLERIGPLLENHPIFPERANISLAHVVDRETINLKVWERGVGLTRACGTAACAVGVAAARTKRTGRLTRISLPGGVLTINWRAEDDHVMMTGPVETEFRGVIDRTTLTWRITDRPSQGAA